MTVRILASGDEPAAENACRLFGLHGAIDASAILASEDAVLVIAEPWRRQGHGTALVTAFIQGRPTRTHAPGHVHVEAH